MAARFYAKISTAPDFQPDGTAIVRGTWSAWHSSGRNIGATPFEAVVDVSTLSASARAAIAQEIAAAILRDFGVSVVVAANDITII